MASWPTLVASALRTSGRGPVFVRIADALAQEVRRGRLTPGQRLPGSRALARELGVHRNTVLAALGELEAQGWLTTSPARGTFISAALPESEVAAVRAGLAPLGVTLPPFEGTVRPALDTPGTTFLSAGTPDPRLVPVELLARTWRRVVRRGGRRLLDYGQPGGHLPLRRALAEMVSTLRGVPAQAEHVLVTRGSQMALDLVARAALRPGDVVAVEALGYRPAWDALRLAGARLVPMPVDREGLDVDALERLARRTRLRAVYVTPHHQYPTTVTMSAARRLALLALARRQRCLILEDDYDHEFHYEGKPVLPLASTDDAGLVVYVGTLSKVLAPGLRLGFLVAPRALVERLEALRAVMDRQGDHPMEAAVAELLEEGELQRHVRKMRVTYQARRDALVRAVTTELDGALEVEAPRGGISLWAQVAPRVDLKRWLARCQARGLVLADPATYAFDGRSPRALRLVFARHTPAELARAVSLLRSELPHG
jgi:GntR family transcriptional regulator/MocR family aminotransferase